MFLPEPGSYVEHTYGGLWANVFTYWLHICKIFITNIRLFVN